MRHALLKTNLNIFVIPAQAGNVVQEGTVYGLKVGIREYRRHQAFWIPACAGMTVFHTLSKRHSGSIPDVSLHRV